MACPLNTHTVFIINMICHGVFQSINFSAFMMVNKVFTLERDGQQMQAAVAGVYSSTTNLPAAEGTARTGWDMQRKKGPH